jgi:spore photoproduct lyase
VYFEEDIFKYKLGQELKQKFSDAEWIPIENHNNIPELRNRPNKDFCQMKKYTIIGVRKTHKYVPNHKTSDFLVPYTSSGCSASCLYCYLVCNYNKCSYLRLFVNREQMMDKLIKTSNESTKELTFEIGSNSDLVLENTITKNLLWTIERFGKNDWGNITFPTKFAMVDSLLDLEHGGKTIVRMSVNPQKIIQEIELGTSPLLKRIEAINKLAESGYRVGLLIAPVIMVEGWRMLYLELLDILEANLSKTMKSEMFIEVIFMTYSFVHRKINEEAFPDAVNLYDEKLMTGRGMGKYSYKQELRSDGDIFLRAEIQKRFPNVEIVYIV